MNFSSYLAYIPEKEKSNPWVELFFILSRNSLYFRQLNFA
jgi:hypothetical protein